MNIYLSEMQWKWEYCKQSMLSEANSLACSIKAFFAEMLGAEVGLFLGSHLSRFMLTTHCFS